MSYEDTKCPCGDRKPTDTMLCDACLDDLKDRREMATFRSAEPVEYRRHAATILLELARGRKRRMANADLTGRRMCDESA
jgi:hypothetical protein